ncbi:MAG TPA: glycoside hydrolase family 32 protein [Propionicimonas sp.]
MIPPSPVPRPRIHFTPRSGWINDPLGLTFHDGRYHLFFQFAPGTTTWSPLAHWGHATSSDALDWTEGPVALAPGEGDDGVWSGSLVCPPGGAAVIFYTSIAEADPQVGRVRIATAHDEQWDVWDKGEVVVPAPPSTDVVVFRDPQVFRDGDEWRMVVGAGLADGTATAFGYVSDDLRHWDETGPVLARHRDEVEPLWTGAVWECPQLFRIGDDWVLTVSVWEPFVPHYEAYAIGTYADGRFTARTWARLTYGPSYYAGSAYGEPDGSRGIVYWLRGVEDVASGWASAHSVPHILRVAGDRLVAEPHPSIERSRVSQVLLEPRGSSATGRVGPVCDIEWDAPVGSALSLVGDGDAEVASMSVDAGGVDIRVGAEVWTVPLAGDRIRILVDGPILEVFTQGGVLAAPLAGVDAALTVTTVGQGQARVYGLGA